jgi:4-diphosphocytidyl-2-C-methyl-D-erythritol kinase
MRFAAFAPAKVNLSLRVGPPGPDGRHPLESFAAFADVGDVLVAGPADTLSLRIEGPFARALEGESDNLVLAAGRLLDEAAGGQGRGGALVLEKRLPVASGIGGGSADAGAALRVLNRLWGLDWPLAALERLAARLGADAPACVGCRPVRMTGTGETLEPITLPSLTGVLVNPGAPASTAAVYRAFDARGVFSPVPAALEADPGGMEKGLASLARLDNDLTAAAIDVCPEIATVIAVLQREPRARLVRLSGSGATVFALTQGRAAAEALAQDLEAEGRGWWIAAANIGAVDAGVRPV